MPIHFSYALFLSFSLLLFFCKILYCHLHGAVWQCECVYICGGRKIKKIVFFSCIAPPQMLTEWERSNRRYILFPPFSSEVFESPVNTAAPDIA